MMVSGRMACLMDKANLFMMMDPCMKGALNRGMPTVSRPFIFIAQAHFIEAKSKAIRLTARVNYQLTNSITRAGGPMTCHMARAGKSMALIPTFRANSSKAKKKDLEFTIGTPRNIIPAILPTTSWTERENSFLTTTHIEAVSRRESNKDWEWLSIIKTTGSMKGSFAIIKWMESENIFGTMVLCFKDGLKMTKRPMMVLWYWKMVMSSIAGYSETFDASRLWFFNFFSLKFQQLRR